MDHEVEDDVYVERAGRKDGEPVSLKKHGAAELGLDGEDGGVEALQMSGLEDSAVLFGEADEVVGFGEGGGEGLFDKEVEAGFEERGGYSMVLDGGDGDGGCVELEVGGEQGGDVGKTGIPYWAAVSAARVGSGSTAAARAMGWPAFSSSR